jgi:hypothetical protein
MTRALEDRLAEVRGRHAALAGTPAGLSGPGGSAVPSPAGSVVPSNDAEETLRLVMVRLWPRARSGGGREDWLALFDALRRLGAAALTDDRRFLDAWNNAFEAFAAADFPEALRADAARFLEAYAALLRTHLARLEGRA